MNDLSITPWRIQREVEELKNHMNTTGYILKHCFREVNQVADKLAAGSHDEQTNKFYYGFEELPRKSKRPHDYG